MGKFHYKKIKCQPQKHRSRFQKQDPNLDNLVSKFSASSKLVWLNTVHKTAHFWEILILCVRGVGSMENPPAYICTPNPISLFSQSTQKWIAKNGLSHWDRRCASDYENCMQKFSWWIYFPFLFIFSCCLPEIHQYRQAWYHLGPGPEANSPLLTAVVLLSWLISLWRGFCSFVQDCSKPLKRETRKDWVSFSLQWI